MLKEMNFVFFDYNLGFKDGEAT